MRDPRPRTADRRRMLGDHGEALVAARYEQAGYSVLDRNWHCREGELDLVLERAGVLVFCEVKTRTSRAFGTPAEAVTREKQRRLRVAAARWLAARAEPGPVRGMRFDVAAVTFGRDRRQAPTIDVIESAF